MNTENNIEWLTGDERACGSFTQKRFVNRMKRLAEARPSEVDIIENEDGSVCVHFPMKWVRISIPPKPREMSEEEKEQKADVLRRYMEKKRANFNAKA